MAKNRMEKTSVKGVYRRGNVYIARVRLRGNSSSATFDSFREAVHWKTQAEADVLAPAGSDQDDGRAEAQATPFTQALERYQATVTCEKRGWAQEITKLNVLRRSRLAHMALSDIKSKHIALYRDERLTLGRRPSTVRRELALISHVFTIASGDWGMSCLSPNPCRKVRRPKGRNESRDRRLLPHEEGYIMAAARQYQGDKRSMPIVPLIILALETSVRRGALARIRWEHISEEARALYVPQSKSDKPRGVALSLRALDALRELGEGQLHEHGPVIRYRNDSITRAWGRVLRRARKRYERDCEQQRKRPREDFLTDLRWHDLRHEATSRFFERELSLPEVMAQTGHTTTQMLTRYTHPRTKDTAAKLDAPH